MQEGKVPAWSTVKNSQEAEGADDFTQAMWRKSSWSAHDGNCVEVASIRGGLIGVRDTKDAGKGPILLFGTAVWHSFLESLISSVSVG